jgi:hypothetical protein
MGAKAELKMEATLEATSELGLKATVGLHVRLSGSESCTEIKGRTCLRFGLTWRTVVIYTTLPM